MSWFNRFFKGCSCCNQEPNNNMPEPDMPETEAPEPQKPAEGEETPIIG